MECPYCGSERIEESVAWGQSADIGNIGLTFIIGTRFFGAVGIAQIYSDLCLDCKTILRSYIKEDTDKNWHHKS